LSGWIEKDRCLELEKILQSICHGSYYLTLSSRSERNKFFRTAPVVLKNNILFRPFEIVVKNLGIPGNSELDPTPIAALAYIFMFGVMFGDVGQGLVLMLIGLLLRRLVPGSKIADGGMVLLYCGFMATIFGFLYGSIFSNEHLIPALWFHPMEHMMDLFFAAIMMGVTFISTGMLLNILNRVSMGHYEEALFGARGIAGLFFYLASVTILVRFIKAGTAPTGTELLLFMAMPLSLFALRNIFAYLFFDLSRPFPHGVFEYIVETLVEIIEMFSGFLGNTISFIRAGAFALSHAGLSIAIYTLADIISPGSASVGAIGVIVIGNIFIILLEGLVCGIQSMRLEYYEFFGKFFKGDGVDFKPFSLKK